MKKILLILSIASFTNFCYSQGLVIDTVKYKKSEQWNPPTSFGFSKSSLSPKISYRKYCPNPQLQTGASCVGWSAAYAALSTQANIQMNITNSNEKWARAFDPNFIYNMISQTDDYDCEKGTSLYDALFVLEKYGCKPRIWEPWLNCKDKDAYDKLTLAIAANYKIDSWSYVKEESFIRNIKIALNIEMPVIIGVNLTSSFMSGSALTYGHWVPKPNEVSVGGHAMCVIGYDDTKFGGAFEVMNSYGKDYGDNGFIWISYKDFEKNVKQAYVLETKKYSGNKCSFGDCENSYSRFKFDNGSVYEGYIIKGEIDAYGSYLYTDGSFYVGGWKTGRKDGYGLLYDEATAKYYDVYYENDVLTESKAKGFALSETDKKSVLKLTELKKTLPAPLADATNFEATRKALAKFDAPDKPLSVKDK